MSKTVLFKNKKFRAAELGEFKRNLKGGGN